MGRELCSNCGAIGEYENGLCVECEKTVIITGKGKEVKMEPAMHKAEETKKRQLVKCSHCALIHNKESRTENGHCCPNCGSVWIDLKYSNPVPPDDCTDAKQTTGKLDLTTVPPAIIESVAKVREHAINGKYKDPENWRRVPWEEYWRAMLRHILAMMRDPMSYDDESGLLHLEHVACNAAFILEMWKGDSDQ